MKLYLRSYSNKLMKNKFMMGSLKIWGGGGEKVIDFTVTVLSYIFSKLGAEAGKIRDGLGRI